ncbi:hypothetical protein QYE77_14985 (plasmid) [Thermanaerothrix sp. 4228-RoL]|jgi:hypothetical protein|uniref:Uncharacterized protein n=1 Tax=Thermanaerothrix solaris TaxID=3058434 RepID=A0ABU3NTM1_9CHLR|nr:MULTISPECIES: hypothetical protein [unclassified Thermanaerothrix]MDT8899568.1 hypothetical protein [Thermanaerothrix sp. 4228-RoL]
MRAQLLFPQIPYGSGLEDWNALMASAKTPEGRRLIEELRSRSWDEKTRSILRRHAVPAPQDVEVLEIYNQAEVAEDFSTPTPPATVARIRATNFDGEIVEIIVDIKDLEFYN